MENKRLTYQIKNLNHEIIRYICEIGVEKKEFPTPAQMQILHYIISRKGNKVYQRDIGNALNLRRATLSEILKTMEKNGLISKVPDKADTRIKEIILSDKALISFETVKKTLNNVEKTIIRGIGQKDLDIFLSVLTKMNQNIEKERMKIC